MKGFKKNEQLLWAEAKDGKVESLVYRLAADVLALAILPTGERMEDIEGLKSRLLAAIADVVDAMDALSTYFHHAIAAFLKRAGAATRAPPPTARR